MSTLQRKSSIKHSPIEIGKYLVSPLTKRLPDHRFSAAVSIRSGRGSATHDRVLRLSRSFKNDADAVRHALDEGRAWAQRAGGLSTSTPTHTGSAP